MEEKKPRATITFMTEEELEAFGKCFVYNPGGKNKINPKYPVILKNEGTINLKHFEDFELE